MSKQPSPGLERVYKNGAFVRPDTEFRHFISLEPGALFPPEPGRYHLYVSYACPWAHRTLIVRKLKGLEDIIGVTSVHPHLDLSTGWRFLSANEHEHRELCGPDPLHDDVAEIRDLYFKANPDYTGRYSVPILWDKKTETIVNNESAEIVQMFNSAFNSLVDDKYMTVDLYPSQSKEDIDAFNTWIYNDINNGVYKAGIARTQDAYDAAVTSLFKSLDRVEQHLATTSKGPYFLDDRLTSIDVFLYTTIIRFDVVYVGLFKCNIRDIRSGYPAIHKWVRSLYWDIPAFKDTTVFEQIKEHYMKLTLLMPGVSIPELP
ncbi:Omega family [Penicillium occitanis (nom. inval.)]|nr:hypothetical protein PENOC_056370 [Penicillium occitanis (nom. inval.)]PCH09085.1 Omega family [Penicillium occitanis (nom. inval.)]